MLSAFCAELLRSDAISGIKFNRSLDHAVLVRTRAVGARRPVLTMSTRDGRHTNEGLLRPPPTLLDPQQQLKEVRVVQLRNHVLQALQPNETRSFDT